LFSKYILIIFTFSIPAILSGQENLDFSNDLYSGINSAPISPTQPFVNPNQWDINFFAEDLFLYNDYVYISQQSLLGLRNTSIKSRSKRKNINGENTPHVLDFYNNDFGNYHFSSDILGPSFSLKTKIRNKEFTFGLFSRLRTQTSAIHVDNYLKFGNEGLLEPEFYTLKPLQINFMNWGELGLNVATEIFPYSDYQWIVGANLKYEIGFDALQIKSNTPLELHRTSELTNGVDTKTIYASNYNIEANFASNYNFDTKKYEFKQKGKGYGLDFGIAVVDRIENSDDYNFKASLNVVDFGQVNFEGERHLFEGKPIKVVNNPNLENTKFVSPNQYFQLLSQEVYGNKKASFQGNDFQIGLPTSIHLNASKNVGEHQYVNADWIQRIPVFENSLKRSNIFNASYSVQKPVLGYGASMSLYEYRSLQFGGYFRIGPLILGSSNVLPLFFNQKKLHSGDFYLALKIYPFWDNEMKQHRRAKCNCDK
jgi:hypothetical protein